MAEEKLVEGWTEQIVQQLLLSGSPLNITGLAVVLEVYTHFGQLLPISGSNYGILDGPTGKVYYNPAPTDLLAKNSPLSVRWKLTDGSGKDSFFPNDAADLWTVRRP